MSVEIHIRRLHRYDDLSAALAGLPDTLNIDAAFIISEIGSLMPAVLRFVGAKTGTVVHSDTEILSLSRATRAAARIYAWRCTIKMTRCLVDT